ncbi:Methyltransferase domain-containing protein [Rathayibacter oskolensis]|uniref:Methyltransferase domain-containing protein n=1 Tax=Rathayibacter oskolensis TaxID=1891671 RepID=A0A1X7PJG0_9MICO|nr:class I SAM-dependent methyltransferase [Rathayibacter oskolensis]SMH51017.1 Methyltransferase domain-containing protein [Rathayibacter oskolensis]
MTGAPSITETLAELRTSALVTAALASALGDERASTPAEALSVDPARAAVLGALPDAESMLSALWEGRRSRSSNLVSGLSQAAAAAGGTMRAWSDLGDDVMIAQGRSSALMARVLLSAVAPAYGLIGAVAPSRVLDVGTGIGAIATALAEGLPDARVVGIDIAERPLEIARDLLRDADPRVAQRIRLRREDVTELADEERYDVVWMPLPFLPDAIVDRALDRAIGALHPGGLLVLGTGAPIADERLRAAEAWLASFTGGGTLTTDEVVGRLTRRGLQRVQRFDTVPGGPVLVGAVRPR